MTACWRSGEIWRGDKVEVLVVGLAVEKAWRRRSMWRAVVGGSIKQKADEGQGGEEPEGDERESEVEKGGANEGFGGTLAARCCGSRGLVGGEGHVPE